MSVPRHGDPSLLFEALSNLVDNALKFSHAIERADRCASLSRRPQGFEVSDSGPGIPTALREAVLRRFYRAEQSRHTPGRGLGPALVAGVAGLHGMTVRIDDGKPGCRIALVGPGIC
jgi:signal transduction histidine kinase